MRRKTTIAGMPETPDDILLRHVTIADLRSILGELGEFWDDPDMEFLHQALYVHEFGETSVLAERDGEILAYLLGFLGPNGTGYIHAVAVRRSARGQEVARRLYGHFEELVRARGASGLKAITRPGNEGSRSFHEAMGFSVTWWRSTRPLAAPGSSSGANSGTDGPG